MKPRSVLITAGPTREKIDPVRFISNYSEGVFGYEIAKAARSRGLKVTLISGPTRLEAPDGVRFISLESAEEMRREVLAEFKRHDCLIMAAAVCDWRVLRPSAKKLKKRGSRMALELEANPDILKEAGLKKAGKVIVGFALETEDLEANAVKKLREKNLDLIIANRVTPKADVFGDNRTDVLIVDRTGRKDAFRNRSKKTLAEIILDKIASFDII